MGLEPVTVQVSSSLNTSLNDCPNLSSATAENMFSTKVRVWFVVVKSVMISDEIDGHGCQDFQVGEQDAGVMRAAYAAARVRIVLLMVDDDFLD